MKSFAPPAHTFSSANRENLESAFLAPRWTGIASIFCCCRASLFLHKEPRFARDLQLRFYLKFTLDREAW